MRRTVHERGDGEIVQDPTVGDALRHFLGGAHRRPGRLGTTHAGEEQILLPPHHPLWHTGGAARVDDVEVVRGTLGKAGAVRALRRKRLVVVNRTVRA